MSPSPLRLKLIIDGQEVEGEKGDFFPVFNPLNGQIAGYSARAHPSDVEKAISAAQKAFPGWAYQTPAFRELILLRAADLLEKRKNELLDIVIDESGSTIGKSEFEIVYATNIIRSAAGEARRLYGDTFPNDKSHRMSLVLREPIGVVASVSPFNGPLLLFVKMTVFALAAGNCVVAKPSEETPLIALTLGKLFLEAGMPPGVFNVLSGYGDCGKVLVEHPKVNGVAFTGSTAVGKMIAQVAAPQMKHLQLELGGKNPLVILKDFDLNKAVDYAIAGAFQHAGQICMASTRIIVERPIFEDFCRLLKKKVEALQIGDLRDPNTAFGPVINQAALNKVDHHVKEAIKSGAKLLTGGKVRSGLIYEPTVLVEPSRDKGIWREETFGPVTTVVAARDADEALELANDTEYGLSAGVLTNDMQKGLLLGKKINSGAVHIGTHSFQSDSMAPLGGFGMSGIGKSGGKFSVDHFTRLRWISIELGQTPMPFKL